MPETKQLSTQTSVIIDGSDISIHTFYNEDLPDIIEGELKEGLLLVAMKNYPTNIDCFINNEGELVVFSNQNDVEQYSLNEDGELIYEF